MLYQTLLGAWPLEGPDATFTERIQAYAAKAAREGKEQTSWLNPHINYEAGLNTFIERILDPAISTEFLQSIAASAQRLALLGALNSLSQLALKATLPGVPDFYQGTEFWDLALVDPDNRRPVDFAERAATLASLSAPDWPTLAADWANGHLKLALTAHLLKLRTESADLFSHGDYQPLEVSGPHRDHAIAFARRHGRDAVVAAVARHFAPFTDGGRAWPRGEAFEGALDLRGYALEGMEPDATQAPLSVLFRELPVAVLKGRWIGAERTARKRVSA
jgi:(1->4)-alpha-D-glucan 1-alpha-D-glucosylmutase